MKLESLPIQIDRSQVLRQIGCDEESPVYDRVLEAYEALLPEITALARGQCLLDTGVLSERDAAPKYPAGTPVIYVIATVGPALERLADRLFAQGDYLAGMLADAMADGALFGLECQWQQAVREICRQKGAGIARRLEAPQDLPISVQETALCVLNAEKELGISLTPGGMLDPVKSLCLVFVLSENPDEFQAYHDCRTCKKTDCPIRTIRPQVTVWETGERGGKSWILDWKTGDTILSAYQRQTGKGSAICGGKGTCGACRIRLRQGWLPVTEVDRKFFGEKQLRDGFRLACRAVPGEDCTIEIRFSDEEALVGITEFRTPCAGDPDGDSNGGLAGGSAGGAVGGLVSGAASDADGSRIDGSGETSGGVQLRQKRENRQGIALDIGTTTLAACLIDLETGRRLAAASRLNRQRMLGADVISRISAEMQGQASRLQQWVREDVDSLIGELQPDRQAVKSVMIAANTTMVHLLCGFSCEPLGTYPFSPVHTEIVRDTYQNLIGTDRLDCEVTVMPGISAFVGGDVVAGIYACQVEQESKRGASLFVDLGTNGEMALFYDGKFLVSSAAAGPAFEGGSLSCGMGSIPGAICQVTMESAYQVRIQTIGKKPPAGLCGTGALEALSELVRLGIVDETGLLSEEYFEEGFWLATSPDGEPILLTQKDIRELQMAKAAVRAGVETLLLRAGIGCEEVSRVYLAGGFGLGMNQHAAVKTGLFPGAFAGKIIPVGNSALAGAAQALMEDGWEAETGQIIRRSEETVLANEAAFGEYYMASMMFREE